MTDPTFETTDKFELVSFALRMEAFMTTEIRFVEDGALVISLNGPFGSGKTTFLRMWRSDISKRRKEGKSLPIPILLNAWESDFCGDPLIAIVSAIVEVLGENRDQRDKKRAETLKEAAKDVANFTIGLAGGFAKQMSGMDAMGAAKFAEEKKAARTKPAKHQDLLAAYEGRRSALAHLKEVLKSAFGGTKLNALVMVDELDRCRPNYAVEYLETIKHVFDIQGLVFVLAIDRAHLESSAKALFGNDLNFAEYYRKFAHRSVELPFPSEQGIARLAEHYATTILEVTDGEFKRSTMLNIRDRLREIAEIAMALKVSLRQMHEMFRLMGHLLACAENQRGKILWSYGAGSVLMAALSVARPQLYRRIGTGSAQIADFEHLFGLFSGKKCEWWAMLVVTGYRSGEAEAWEKLLAEFIRIGALPTELSIKENRQRLGQFAMGWGDGWGESGLDRIYNNLEGLNGFATS